MNSKLLAVGLLVAGCVTAAAGGAYLAVRHNAAPEPAAIAEPPAPANAPTAPAPVAETEAIVSPPAAAEAPAAEEATKSAPAPRTAPRVERSAPAAARYPARRSTPATVPPPTAAAPPAPPRPVEPATPPAQPVEAIPDPQVRAPEPPAPPVAQFEEVVLPSSSVIGLEVETPLSSERSRLEDRVDARVTRDVLSAGRVAIPAGSRVIGSVTLVERGGKLKDRARLGVRFHTLVLGDGREVALRSETIYREGDSHTGENTRKIGGAAIGGAILGGILGGGKGAAIGGAAGAAGGTAAVMAGDRNAATLPAGTIVTVRLSAPATIEVERK